MSLGVFKYSVLQFVPSQVLNERVNIGIILFFPEEHSVRFIYPKHLKRLKYLYHKIQERKILVYLDQISVKVKDYNLNKDLFSRLFFSSIELVEFLDTKILKSDDSALQFSKIYESLLYSSDYEKICNDLYEDYFSEYVLKPNVTQINESDIKRNFERTLKNEFPGLIEKFEHNVTINTENNDFHFDYAWQNGSLNLVKPVSFDLKESKKIQEKSILLYGNLSLLSHIARTKDYKFDLIIAKPRINSTFNSFDRALKTIDKADVKKEFIFQDNIKEYIFEASKAVI